MAIPIGKLSIGAFLLLVTSSLLVSQCQATPVRQEDHRILLGKCAIEGKKAARYVQTLDMNCSELQASTYMISTVPECDYYFELGCNQVRKQVACASGVSMVLSDFPRNVNFSCDTVTGLDNEVLSNLSCCMVCIQAIKESRSGNPCALGMESSILHTWARLKCCKTASVYDRKVAFGLPINSSSSHRLNHTDPLVTSTLTSTTSTTPTTSTTTTTTTTTTTSTPSSLNVNDSTSETPTTLTTTPTETTTITPTTSSPESEKVTAGNEVENEESPTKDSESNIIPHHTVNRNEHTRDSNWAVTEPSLTKFFSIATVGFGLPINSSLSHRLNHSYPLVTSTLTSTTSTTPTTPTTTTTPIIIKNATSFPVHLEKHEYIPIVYPPVIEAHSGPEGDCHEGLIWSEEKHECVDNNECVTLTNPCNERETCYNHPGGYTCCPLGTQSSENSFCAPIDHCEYNKTCSQSEFCVNYFVGSQCVDRIERGYKDYSRSGILKLINEEDKLQPKFLRISQRKILIASIGAFGFYKRDNLILVKLPDRFQCDWKLTLDDVWIPDSLDPIRQNQFSEEIKPNEFRAYISGQVYPQSFRVSVTCEIDGKPYYRNTIYFTFTFNPVFVGPVEG